VIPTPGHSNDHICLYEPNEGWLFSGDLFISEQVKYLRKDEDIYSLLDSLRKVASLQPKKMFCAFSGVIDRPEEAIHRKIDYLENLRSGVERGLQQGLTPPEIQQKLLGRGDRFRFITAGQISKKNLIDAFLKH
jgi:glyoxylase-like metal-dependent hydrolase (beta-lactamase superfamily II)